MPRIRTIKPEFWDSPDTIRASLRARLLYVAMWNWADDYGIGDANLNRLISFAFPGDDVPASDFPTLASEVSGCFGVMFYEHLGRPYYWLPTWEKHQRTEKKARQHVPYPENAKPAPDQDREPSDVSVGFSDASVGSSGPGTRGTRGTRGTGELGEQGGAGGNDLATVEPPAQDSPGKPPRKRGSRIPEPFLVSADMRRWAADEVPTVDVDAATRAFVDYWRAESGTKATKVDWTAAWRNWLRRDQTNPRTITTRESSLDRVARQHAETAAQLRGEGNHDPERSTRPALNAGHLRPA